MKTLQPGLKRGDEPTRAWASLGWIASAGVLALTVAATGSEVLHLPRAVLVGLLAATGFPFLYAYLKWSGLDLRRHLCHRWPSGLAGATISSTLVVANVLAQPASSPARGVGLLFDLVWLGLVYGLLDALMLSILPVVAVRQAFESQGWTRNRSGRMAAGAVGLAASLWVTAAYHLGYPEFRGPELSQPVIGNAILTLAYLLSGNPLAAIISHVVMHAAAVLHGAESTLQLPPHYG